MKKGFKDIIILGLVFIFALTASLCCDPSIAQAEANVPKCHQTTQDTDSSQNSTNDDGCCLDLVSLNLDKINIHFEQFQIAKFVDWNLNNKINLISSNAEAYQAPPQYYNSSPLYIKHSILRI